MKILTTLFPWLAPASSQQNVTISFNDRLVLNRQAQEKLEPAYKNIYGTGMQMILTLAGIQITANRKWHGYGMGADATGSITFDPNQYKRTMNDYLQLQTESIRYVAQEQIEPFGALPADFDMTQFDTTDMVIGKFRRNNFTNTLGASRTEVKSLLEEMQHNVKQAQTERSIMTAYYGVEALF